MQICYNYRWNYEHKYYYPDEKILILHIIQYNHE